LETLVLSSISAPLSKTRETMESWPPLQAQWRGVEPSYREEDERRTRGGGGGGMTYLRISKIEIVSPLEEESDLI
jgi:hypothetical protein